MKKPTKADLLAAADKTLSDLLAPDLRVLFCGINPGLYSAYTGYHFARPGNRFWPALYKSGFTDRQLDPSEAPELLTYGYGMTCMVQRATATADELTQEEVIAGGQRLLANVTQYKPKSVAILGIGVYRTAFNRPRAVIGKQPEKLAEADLWILPSPSGLNAHYNLDQLAGVFREFRLAIDAEYPRENGKS